MLYDVMKKNLKEVLLTLRVRPEIRDEFRVVAEMKGSTMSGLIHQFMMRTIRDMQDTYPEEFRTRLRELERSPLNEIELPTGRVEAASPRTNKGKVARKTNSGKSRNQ